MHLDIVYPSLLLLALQLPSRAAATKPKNAILLSEVQSLTLYADKPTTHRRVSAIPQLKCVSPRAICALHTIDVLRCVNQGAGYAPEDVQWACKAQLPPTLRLGSTDVICEGYASADDEHVLRGSCGVEYRLVLTEEGERLHPGLAGGGGSGSLWGGGRGDTDWSGYVFGLIFFAVAAWIVWSACVSAQGGNGAAPARRRPRNNFWGGGGGGGWGPGGGGGGGRWDDPPPPYPGTKPSTEQGWRPGFWSGLAGGAAAGYMAGNRGRRDDYNRNTGWGGGGGNNGGGWFGSGAGPSRGSSGSSSGSSTARHESTGFGSTSRR